MWDGLALENNLSNARLLAISGEFVEVMGDLLG
jgi:hypothetical protein